MFGYIRTDQPYLYIKDQTLYNAMYCGLCKAIGKTCGQSARFALSYDLTFFSVLMHNISGTDVKVEKQHCATHFIGKRKPMANVDEITEMLGAVNTVLAYYKVCDDIEDENKGGVKKMMLQKGFKRAKKRYPELERIARENLKKQAETEKNHVASLDVSADRTATMVAEISNEILKEKKTEFTERLFYLIGKWIYLIDALDDYDKDIKKKNYNPFYLVYGEPSKTELTEKHKEDVEFVFHSLFYDLRETLSHIPMHFNRDLVDNILLRGLPKETEKVMNSTKNANNKERS